MTGDGTRAVRAGLPEPEAYEPTLPGPVFAAHYHLPGDAVGPYTYGRDANPTWTRLEQAIGELESPEENAHTVAFASGMAAITAVLFSQLRSGDAVVLPSDGYQLLLKPSARVWRATASRSVRRRRHTTHSSMRWTAPGCCGSRHLPTPASTSATSGGWPTRRTAGAPWSPSTTLSPPRSASARSTSARTSRWPAAPRR